jgi:hypothetical protein
VTKTKGGDLCLTALHSGAKEFWFLILNLVSSFERGFLRPFLGGRGGLREECGFEGRSNILIRPESLYWMNCRDDGDGAR